MRASGWPASSSSSSILRPSSAYASPSSNGTEMYHMRSTSPSSTWSSGWRREWLLIDSRATSRNSSSVCSRRAAPIRLKRSGSAPSCARL